MCNIVTSLNMYSMQPFCRQDEADILGDRIAIMAEGRLRCAGSSLFLKKTCKFTRNREAPFSPSVVSHYCPCEQTV